MRADDSEPTTIEECAAAPYRTAYESARDWLRLGMHPDAVRLWFHLADAEIGATWRGVEDALAGRPSAP